MIELVKQSHTLLNNTNPLKLIELAGRTCYKSETNINDLSSFIFAEKLKKNGHTSVLEHGSLYLKFTFKSVFSLSAIRFYLKSLFNKYTVVKGNRIYTNYRVLFEVHKDRIPTKLVPFVPLKNDLERRQTVRLITNRAISNELVRHRECSFSQESTRYVNYSKKGIAYIIPLWLHLECGEYDFNTENKNELVPNSYEWRWVDLCLYTSETYVEMLKKGLKPEQARGVLPLDLKTEIVITASLKQWKALFALRTDKSAHPQIIELCEPLESEMFNQ